MQQKSKQKSREESTNNSQLFTIHTEQGKKRFHLDETQKIKGKLKAWSEREEKKGNRGK